MRMRHLALVIVALAAPAFAQQDDWKWDPKKKAAPVVGTRRFVEEEDSRISKVTVSIPNQPEPRKQNENITVTSRLVREVLAVSGDKISKEKVVIEKWTRTAEGHDPDKSLEGVTVLVEGLDQERKATIQGDAKVSDVARKWVQTELTKSKEAGHRDELLDPKEPVANDGEWTIDPKAVGAKMFKNVPVDVEKSTCKGKLTDVKVVDGAHHGHMEVSVKLQLKQVPGMMVDWTEGGLVDLKIVGDGSLESDKSHAGKVSFAMALAGKGERETAAGLITIEMDLKMKRSATHGDLPANK